MQRKLGLDVAKLPAVGNTKHFLQLPHPSPKTDAENAANWRALERWANGMTAPVDPVRLFGITVELVEAADAVVVDTCDFKGGVTYSIGQSFASGGSMTYDLNPQPDWSVRLDGDGVPTIVRYDRDTTADFLARSVGATFTLSGAFILQPIVTNAYGGTPP